MQHRLTSCCGNIITLKLHPRNLIQYAPPGETKINVKNHRQKEETQPLTSPAKKRQENKPNEQRNRQKTSNACLNSVK